MTINAVASASPSISPMTITLTPSVVAINSGSRLWIISEETSISRLTPPKIHTPRGMRPNVAKRDDMVHPRKIQRHRRRIMIFPRLDS
ncbi:hypothetical protein [Serratia marcescens]|uniref:hypothetical protein n=1 Tax=Serratia marcescens TaxID=615 RepID=UPI00223EDECB|nr:hypothetical protein [Serratia marcescens]